MHDITYIVLKVPLNSNQPTNLVYSYYYCCYKCLCAHLQDCNFEKCTSIQQLPQLASLLFSIILKKPSTALYACIFVVLLVPFFSKRERDTLRLLYAIAIPSVVCLLSVTLVHPTQAVELFLPYDSPGTLLFWCQKSLVGTPLYP